ncbi:arsenite methyltransferase [Glonium stellatum]|uniref:Arsenite methyltransferase n=1 Tax=Glonium stellatum TaxID=574774 RepID=A0A8E2JUG2_9PEZI|nr:arsenite methyltransferase [Glonium stellatum]
MDAKQIYEKVQERYGSAAKESSGEYAHVVAKAFGYSEEELTTIPKDANLGLSCGNPLALAKLGEGETVIDLGSGAGFDIFLAAKMVGAHGRAIGVDMNKDMLERANRNREAALANNVSFIESAITAIPLPDGSAHCIISNCVVNLVPEQEKQLAFNEMFRLLKPGGRVAISDILTRKDLPKELKENMALYVGCIAGASRIKDYERYLQEAGFQDILIVDSKHDLNVYTDVNKDGSRDFCCGSGKQLSYCKNGSSCCGEDLTGNRLENSAEQYKGFDFNEWAGSFKIYAVK